MTSLKVILRSLQKPLFRIDQIQYVTTQGIINADSLLTPMFALLAYPDADYPKAYPIENRSMLIVY